MTITMMNMNQRPMSTASPPSVEKIVGKQQLGDRDRDRRQRHQHQRPGREQAGAVLGPAGDEVAEALRGALANRKPDELATVDSAIVTPRPCGPSARATTMPVTRLATSVSAEKM